MISAAGQRSGFSFGIVPFIDFNSPDYALKRVAIVGTGHREPTQDAGYTHDCMRFPLAIPIDQVFAFLGESIYAGLGGDFEVLNNACRLGDRQTIFD